ncbi:MAG: GNAT-like putative antirestriction protein [Nitrospirota bacterium]
MKYRGLYELVKRVEKGKGGPFINYQGKFNYMSLKEVVGIWLKKYKK